MPFLLQLGIACFLASLIGAYIATRITHRLTRKD